MLIVGAALLPCSIAHITVVLSPAQGGSLWIILWASLKSVGKTSPLSKMPKL
jgi:hypothetical protein